MSLLGNFLELSISSDDLIADMSRYQDYGMQELTVTDARPYHYGVMSDGQMFFGFHQAEFASPSLTFVLQDLENNMGPLKAIGVDMEFERFSDERFHEAAFLDPAGTRVTLLEARTFSPALPREQSDDGLGNLLELRLPATNKNDDFWSFIKECGTGWQTMPLVTDADTQQLTVVYKSNLEELIVRAAREGWKDFTVTKDNQGLLKSPHGYHLLIEDGE